MASMLRCLRRPFRTVTVPRTWRTMSSVSFPDDGSHFQMKLDESDDKLLQTGLLHEEDINTPIPFGPDFLDVQIGEVLPPENSNWDVVRADHEEDERVQILRKIGFGDHASVWLAQTYPPGEDPNFCAVKVFSAHAGPIAGPGGYNVTSKILKIIEAGNAVPAAAHHICHPIWSVIMKQPVNFKETDTIDRLISVLPLCGPSLMNLQGVRVNHVIPIQVWKKVFVDMLKALRFLHERCGMVHGNITQSDILVGLDMEPGELKEMLDAKDIEPAYYPPTVGLKKDLYIRDPEDTSSVLRTITEPMSVPIFDPSWAEDDFGDANMEDTMTFRLGGFGSAQEIPTGSHVPDVPLNATPHRAAPELILGLPWDEKVDIWALGYTMMEVLGFGPIFRSPPGENENVGDNIQQNQDAPDADRIWAQNHLAAILAYTETESFPRWMVEQANLDPEFFDADGQLTTGVFESPLDDEAWTLLEQTFETQRLQRTELIAGEMIFRNVMLRLQANLDKKRLEIAENETDEAASKLSDEQLFDLAKEAEAEDASPNLSLSRGDVEALYDASLVIKKCMALDPRERPTARELLSLPFFRNMDIDETEEAFDMPDESTEAQ